MDTLIIVSIILVALYPYRRLIAFLLIMLTRRMEVYVNGWMRTLAARIDNERFRHVVELMSNAGTQEEMMNAIKCSISFLTGRSRYQSIPYMNTDTPVQGEIEENSSIICPVCQENIKEGENIIILPCHHMGHSECLNKWLIDRVRCPMCNGIC